MSFKKQTTDFDLGQTQIENIFINEFMPMADGTAVKVYLLAYKHSLDEDSKLNFSNKSLAKYLNLALEDVLRSWDFWESKGIIKKIATEDDYDIEFLSLRQLTAKGVYASAKKVDTTKEYTGNNLNLIEANKNPEIRKMFYAIDQIMRRELVPNERINVLDWIYKQNINIDIIVSAFKYSVETRGVKNINYVSTVVRGWHDKGILNLEELEDHFAQSNSHYNSYKIVYRTLGYSNKLTSAGDKELIDVWLDEYKLDIDLIVRILTDCSKRTSNINMNYVNKAIENLYKAGVDSLEKYSEHQEKQSTKPTKAVTNTSYVKKNKFHDFKQRDRKYTNEELKKKLSKKNK